MPFKGNPTAWTSEFAPITWQSLCSAVERWIAVLKLFFVLLFVSSSLFSHVQAQEVGGRVASSDCFSDEALKNTSSALVYVWSPRMVLSAIAAHHAAEQAQHFQQQFIPVVDGRLPRPEWQAALQTLQQLSPASAQALAATQVLCSPQLIQAYAYRHFPSAYVVEQGHVQLPVIVGAMPSEFWQMAIAQRRQSSSP